MIGIIGAMDVEIEQLLLEIKDKEQTTLYSNLYYKGTIGDIPVVITKSGVGKVNASIAAQTLIQHYEVSSIVFIGVAGALHPELDIGDMIISTSCQEHDLDASTLGFPRGTIPFQEVSEYPADPQLIDFALAAGNALEGIQVRSGKVLSGDQFISDPNLVSWLQTELAGDCVEMEGAAVAHVCYLLQIPYVVIRSMSDRADHKAPVNFVEFTQLAAIRSGKLVTSMLHHIRDNGGL
jgi:adenosylhomocysteine nucleosidase